MFAVVLMTNNKSQHSAYLTHRRLTIAHDGVDLCHLALTTMMMEIPLVQLHSLTSACLMAVL